MGKLKQWILNKFFKDELEKMKESHSKKIKQIENEMKIKHKDMEIVHKILSEKNMVIVGEADNNSKEHVFIVQNVYRSSIQFMLYSKKYFAVNNHPRIMATYNNLIDNKPYIKIDDILVEDDNVGNGSILIPYFIEYCKQFTDAKKISGWLSPVDKDHFERSIHFYEKHGFLVKLNEKGDSGSIEYLLT